MKAFNNLTMLRAPFFYILCNISISSKALGNMTLIYSFERLGGTFLNFECHVELCFKVLGNPDSGKLSPTQFVYYNISVVEYFANEGWMVSSNFVRGYSFIIRIGRDIFFDKFKLLHYLIYEIKMA